MKKIYFIAGEASGDLHSSNLIKELTALDSGFQFRGRGGPLMVKERMELQSSYEKNNYMGFLEVIKHLPEILAVIKSVQVDIIAWNPDAIILVDYPGFNLRIAKWAHKYQIPCYYYISPQMWAWKEGRVEQIRKYVKELIAILPFEQTFYKNHGIDVQYFGHPLEDYISNFIPDADFRIKHQLDDRNIIALLPGSRDHEIKSMLPIYVEATKNITDHQLILAGIESQASLYDQILKRFPDINVKIIHNSTYNILSQASAALVTSGTATLETALFKVPQVVCYKANPISVWIARRLIKVKYICLVNLILDKGLVTELIQEQCNPEELKTELQRILDPGVRARIQFGYSELAEILGSGNASKATAQYIFNSLQKL